MDIIVPYFFDRTGFVQQKEDKKDGIKKPPLYDAHIRAEEKIPLVVDEALIWMKLVQRDIRFLSMTLLNIIFLCKRCWNG